MPGSTLTIRVSPPFDLPRAVCSYGYFMLAPNQWDASKRVLHTVVRDAAGDTVGCAVTQPAGCDGSRLRVRCDRRVSRDDAGAIKRQIGRMLRLDEDFTGWRRVHPKARRARFDRLIRSATLFEDIVKTMTGCNVTWPSTIRMNQLLCEHVGGGGFPTPAQVACFRHDQLKQICKVGYRAERIVRLARDVESGALDLGALESSDDTTDDLFRRLRQIHGIGPYAAGNLCQLLGRYDRMAIDSETYRHFREAHGITMPKTPGGLRRLHARIDRHYEPYAPYQLLAYWFELWNRYKYP